MRVVPIGFLDCTYYFYRVSRMAQPALPLARVASCLVAYRDYFPGFVVRFFIPGQFGWANNTPPGGFDCRSI